MSLAPLAGTTVGAGILALPAVTAESGFAASAAALTGFALFSITTGLLVAEVNLNTLCELGASRGVSLSSMARRTLGDAGARAVSATYLLLHFALLVAYIAKAGETLQAATGLPLAAVDAAFVAAFGGLCFAARPATLDGINSVLVALVVASFLGLLGAAATDVRPELLAAANWDALPDALPVIALAFVYQNVVPVIATSLEGNVGKIRQAVLLGTAVPWLMFLAWDAAVLGSSGSGLLGGADGAIVDPLAALRQAANPAVAPLLDSFTFLAIATSFIGFVLGLSDFIADALKLPTGRQPVPYLLTLVPPLVLALSFPDVFFSALEFAGTYGVLVLFGLIPVAMVWSERYAGTTLSRIQVVPGGKPVLLLTAGVAAGVIAHELLTSAAQLAG
ncbi:hypothetical protein ABPG77_004189 [Micractinium sp. CCAP 211/92]